MFQVTTLISSSEDDPTKLPTIPETNKLDYKDVLLMFILELIIIQDFFGKPTFLQVSGQLEAETYALGLCDAYTFGPTFRAERSHTSSIFKQKE